NAPPCNNLAYCLAMAAAQQPVTAPATVIKIVGPHHRKTSCCIAYLLSVIAPWPHWGLWVAHCSLQAAAPPMMPSATIVHAKPHRLMPGGRHRADVAPSHRPSSRWALDRMSNKKKTRAGNRSRRQSLTNSKQTKRDKPPIPLPGRYWKPVPFWAPCLA